MQVMVRCLTQICIKRSFFYTWWRHQMETFSALLAIFAGNSPVTGDFPVQKPVRWSFDVFYDLRLHKPLGKQSWGWWFETRSRSPASQIGCLLNRLLTRLTFSFICAPTIHYADVIMTTMASQITSLTVVYSIVYSLADQRKHQSSASLAFVWGIHRDRWIPRAKGQLRGKCFHLMTSSCSRDAGDLKRHRGHSHATVMFSPKNSSKMAP